MHHVQGKFRLVQAQFSSETCREGRGLLKLSTYFALCMLKEENYVLKDFSSKNAGRKIGEV